jgi:hypothetical protein
MFFNKLVEVSRGFLRVLKTAGAGVCRILDTMAPAR